MTREYVNTMLFSLSRDLRKAVEARAILECKQRLASVPMTVETADLAYVSTMLGFIALRLDAAVA